MLDELNAKIYKTGEIAIDTDLTPELLAEGAVRELMRAVQGKRKTEGLEPDDRVVLTIETDEVGVAAVTTHQDLLLKTVGATTLNFGVADETVTIGDYSFNFRIEKI